MEGEPIGLHSPSALADIVGGWRILAGCILGMGVGVVAMPAAAISIFMTGLQADFGWSRTQISLGSTILFAVLIVTSPIIGWLSDKVAEARIVAVSLVAMAGAFLLLSQIGGNIGMFWIGFGLMALVGSGAATVPFARIIVSNFDRNRGLALGLAMIGTGVSAVILPIVLVPYVAINGWRSGFVVLAITMLLAVPLLLYLLRGARRADTHAAAATAPPREGKSLAEAARTREFWTLGVGFTIITLGAAGIMAHYVAMLTDAGLSPARVGVLASLTGASTIVIRVATGWLLDRVFAPYVAAAMMLLAALCLASFGAFGSVAAPAGAIAYGLAIGSEIDLIAYFSARYFGMRAYGRIYGVLYAVQLVGVAVSPMLYGMAVDATQSYEIALFGAAALLTLAATLLLTLPRFLPVAQSAEAFG